MRLQFSFLPMLNKGDAFKSERVHFEFRPGRTAICRPQPGKPQKAFSRRENTSRMEWGFFTQKIVNFQGIMRQDERYFTNPIFPIHDLVLIKIQNE